MMLRNVIIMFSKYLAVLICLITLLLATPWGTQASLSLINNINGVAINYQSGSLIGGIKLNSFHLKLSTLELEIKGLSTAIRFSCLVKKTICINSAKANYLALRYVVKRNTVKEASINQGAILQPDNSVIDRPDIDSLVLDMPFSIDVDGIAVKEIEFIINKNKISINQLIAQLSVVEGNVKFFKPTAKKLIITLENNAQDTSNHAKGATVNKSLINLPDLSLPIALTIEQLKIDDIILKTKNTAQDGCQPTCPQWRSSNNKLSATWFQRDVNISQFSTTTRTFSVTQLASDIQLIWPYKINAQVTSHLSDVAWWPEINNTTTKIALHGSLETLSFDVISMGNLAFTSQGEVNLLNENFPFNLHINASAVPTPLSFSQYGAYSVLSLGLSGDIHKQSVELSSQVSGYGYNNAQLTMMASRQGERVNIKNFVFNDADSDSQLNLQGELGILPADIRWQLSADSTGVSLPKINLHSLLKFNKNPKQSDVLTANLPDVITGRLTGKLTTSGAWSNEQWFASLSNTHIAGNINNSALKIEADINLSHSGNLPLGKLFIGFNQTELTLQTDKNDDWGLKGQLTTDNLNLWHHDLKGTINSQFSISGHKNNPTIHLDSQLSQLHWQNFTSPLLTVAARYQPMNNHKIKLTVNNNQLNWLRKTSPFTVDKFTLVVEGDATFHQINAIWLGDSTGQLTLTGNFNDNLTHWKSVFDQSKLTYLNASLENDKAFDFTINLADKKSHIESHCWQGKGLNICLPKQTIIGDSADIQVNFNIDLSVIDDLWLPKNIELISQVDGNINLNWSLHQRLAANAHVDLSPGYLKVIDDYSENHLSQWSKGSFTLVLNERQLTNTFLLTGINDYDLLNVNSTIDLIDDYPVNAQIDINQFNLQPFQSTLNNVVNLQGSLSAKMKVDGTLNDPILNGDIALAKGKLKLGQNANVFNNISSRFTFKDNQGSLAGHFYIDDKIANLKGNMSWKDSLIMNVDLTAETLPLLFPPQLAMNISPQLNFNLIDKSLSVSGQIDVLNGRYNIEKLPQSSVSLSDDVIVINNDGQTLVKKSSDYDIKTNILVNIDRAFEIEGQGLKSHLLGQLHINQKEKHPFQLFGKIQSIDGNFKAYGQKLTIEKGEFTFNGAIDNPYFNLHASRHIKAEDIDVGIKITGLADALDMQLYSSSLLENPQILSYLIRGRGLDVNTENSSAAASLLVGFGVTNSLGIFQQIEKIPFINNIAVDTDGVGDQTQATVSGYVGNKVYLKYGVGVYEPINELTVRLFLFNRFWLEVVSGIEQSTDLYYSFDVD